ncbi:MAG TPA: hypothetical protein VFF30_12340 [Nitrososphaerales archaeon]|nr:hypothetical protein [Nitrososphaerales archaeon]
MVSRQQGINKARKKVTRAFKIDDNLDRTIAGQAEKTGITPSSLVSQILRRYVEWGQFTGVGTNFVTIDKEVFAAFLDELSEDRIVEIARSSALVSTHNFLKFRYQRINFDTIRDFLGSLSAHSNVGEVRIMEDEDTEHSGRYEINARHSLGMKWSIFLSEYISGILSSFLEMQTTTEELSPLGCSVIAVRA